MYKSFLDNVSTIQIRRDGQLSVALKDGRIAIAVDEPPFAPASAIADVTFDAATWRLQLQTVRNDVVHVELPTPLDPSPVLGRPTIYLDQNHWSTLTLAIHDPARVPNTAELAAASQLVALADAREIILPMSAAHMAETCKQLDPNERYIRALTITQLSRGWQLRDPLHIRLFELRGVLSDRYGQPDKSALTIITLEPDALHSGRDGDAGPIGDDFPSDAQQLLHAMRCASANVDTMLDREAVSVTRIPGWVRSFQQFADFLGQNPPGKELKRRRTLARFVADLDSELCEAARGAGVSQADVSDWIRSHCENDIRKLPALGLFREVVHEKLSDTRMRWEDNDLVDMMYLTAASGYCAYVVAERAHASHVRNSVRRLGRTTSVHVNLRSLLGAIS